MGETLATTLALEALDMALAHRKPAAMYHSDRGTQYASDDYHRRRIGAGLPAA